MIDPRFRIPISIILTSIWIIANGIIFRMTILPGSELRYLLIPFFLWALVLLIGIRYVQRSLNFSKPTKSLKFIAACMLGISLPELIVQDGIVLAADGNENTLITIGGPGKLHIQTGSAALVEDCRGGIRVLGAGEHFISRYETLNECTHLEERYQPIDYLTTRSKDGIEVAAKDIRYRFRISSEGIAGRSGLHRPEVVYRFSEGALKRFVFGRAQADSSNRTWDEDIRILVEAVILNFIQRHQVDYLIAPGFQSTDPRAELYKEFSSEEGKKKFLDLGAELTWIDIGHFETPEENVAQQRVATWQAKWQGNEYLLREYSEAEKLGHTEALEEVLRNILDGLEAIGPPGDGTENLQPLYLARIAQIIDALKDVK